jgi:hypothetical protein
MSSSNAHTHTHSISVLQIIMRILLDNYVTLFFYMLLTVLSIGTYVAEPFVNNWIK